MSDKQAVLIIHGIGEQKPMGTLRDFVTAVWTSDTSTHINPKVDCVWSKPDNLSRSFELRRLTTSKNTKGVRTDFFEFYWAHMLEGTTYGHFFAWARTLLLRRPGTVPERLRPVYWLLVFLTVVGIGLVGAFTFFQTQRGFEIPKWVSGLAALLIWPVIAYVILKCVGDAARYLHVAPDNIKSRHAIRAAGVELLKELHDPARGYDRIVIVGHSLGSVIGYDMLTHAWADFNLAHKPASDVPPSLDALEKHAAGPNLTIDQVQAAQRQYHKDLRARGCEWRVTDFVTMGSPLSHAAILLANDLDDLRSKQNQREFPTSLPTLEKSGLDQRFSFDAPKPNPNHYRLPHHAAVFGPTRWTNLYFPCRGIIKGDVIGGPLCGVMGNEIKDVAVETNQRGGYLAHTLYWIQSKGVLQESHIDALRKAVNLLDNP